MSLESRWQKFLGQNGRKRFLLFEATCFLAIGRMALLFFQFSEIAKMLGRTASTADMNLSPGADTEAEQVGWGVETMARHVPWKCSCLVQALAAFWMLSRRGIVGTVHFGVAPAAGKKFNAHAWLRCGSRIITGGNNLDQFKVLTSFSSGAR